MKTMINKEVSNMLKGCAAIFVLVNHIVCWLVTVNDVDTNIRELFGRLSDTGMFSFLFISGYGLYKSSIKNKMYNYWEKKIVRIVFPMLCANCIGAFTFNLSNGIIPARKDLFEGITSICLDYNGIMWYIHYLLVWYMVFWMIFRILESRVTRIIAWIIAACIISYLTPEIFGLANEYYLAFPFGVLWSSLEYNNSVFAHFIKFENIIIQRLGVVITCIGILISTKYFRDISHSIGNQEVGFWVYSVLINCLLGVTMIGLILSLIRINGLRSRIIFKIIGKYSLAIYLLQEPIIFTWLKNINSVMWAYTVVFIGLLFIGVIKNVYDKTIGRKLELA